MMDYRDFGIELPAGRTSGEVRCKCPQCSKGRRPEHRNERDLSVNVDEGTWYCFHCDWSGGLKVGESSASKPRSVESGKREHKRPAPLKGELTAEALAFFASRRIPREVLERNGIVVVRGHYFTELDGKRDAIAYPYYRDGELINIKYRAQGDKKFQLVGGCERTLYGLDDVAGAETIIIVEGEMDKLAVEAAGYRNCVSVPDGAPPPDARSYSSKFAFLTESTAEAALKGAEKIILATDADEPGQKLAAELARRLGKERCWRVDFSAAGAKDANEALIKLGPDWLKEMIDEAKPWPIEGVSTPMDVRLEVLALFQGDLEPGEKTGFDHLKWHVKPGQLTVVTGMPGSGKSEWVDAVVVNLAKSVGWGAAYFSPENHPIERHVAKLAEKWSGKAFRKWRDESEVMGREELESTLKIIDQRFVFLNPNTHSLDAVLELAGKEIYRRGIRSVVLDPWNRIEHARPHGMSETEYVAQCLGVAQRFAQNRGVHVWFVAHPTKMMKVKDERDGTMYYPIPTPYDISGSAHWFNIADNCLTVWRDKENEAIPVQVHVFKVRFRECGELGMVEVMYNPANGTYRSIKSPDSWHAGTKSRA